MSQYEGPVSIPKTKKEDKLCPIHGTYRFSKMHVNTFSCKHTLIKQEKRNVKKLNFISLNAIM